MSHPTNPSQGVDEALSCRREFPERNHERCGKPAEFIVWGKLFPTDALGPRCYDCAAAQVGHHGLVLGNPQGYAIYHLPNLSALRKQIREELEGELLSADSISAVSRVQTATSSPGGFIEIGPTAALEALHAALSSLKERER